MNFEKKGHSSSVILAKLFPQNILFPGGSLLADSQGVQLFLLLFYFGLENELWKKKGHPSRVILVELFPQNVLSPGGSLLADSQRGPIVFTYVLFGVGRGTGGSKTYRVYCGFFFRKCFIWWDGLDGWDGWDGWTGGRVGRSRKVSFKILHTLWVYRLGIYLLIYGIKVVTKILMGFKIWCQVGVWGTQFSKLPYVREFLNIWFQKLSFFVAYIVVFWNSSIFSKISNFQIYNR